MQTSLIILALLLYGCGSNSSSNQQSTTVDNTASSSSVDTNLVMQEEPYYKYEWHLNALDSPLNTQGYTIHPEADISIEQAWSISRGLGVKVAVIDDGFEVDHEDLQGNIIATYNADDESSDVGYYGSEGAHGSSCAGFIAAPLNGMGIVGVAPDAKLILIKHENGSDASLIRAFEYAKNQGAKVISCSWGTEQVSEAVEAKLQSLYNAGITVLFASGNDGKDLDTEGLDDESEVEWVIGVGASSESNDVTSYSNYGANIDLLAPGGDIEISSGLLALDDMGREGLKHQRGLVNENYSFTEGTSFACPIAAGVVALLYSREPTITPKEVRERLIETAQKVGSATYSEEGFDISKRRGYGKIDAAKAVGSL